MIAELIMIHDDDIICNLIFFLGILWEVSREPSCSKNKSNTSVPKAKILKLFLKTIIKEKLLKQNYHLIYVFCSTIEI